MADEDEQIYEDPKKSKENEDKLKLKIAKKAYVFDVRRKYAVTKTFAVKKSPETPGEKIKDQVLSFFKKRKGAYEEKEKPAQAAAQGKSSTMMTALGIAGIVILLFILGIVYVFISVGSAPSAPPAAPPPAVFEGAYNFTIEQARVLSVEPQDNPKREGYFLAKYGAAGLNGLNFTASLYREKPSIQVFVLDYAKESADSYPEILKGLKRELPTRGIEINEIGVESLSNLPDGAILLIPTGYMPKELLGIDSNLDYGQLLDRGVNIIYIGYPFDNTALDNKGQTVPVERTELLFSSEKPDSDKGFNLFDAQYTVSPSQSGSAQGFQGAGRLYGSISVIKKGNGAMMFLPVYLDSGWVPDIESTGSEKAIADLTRLIEDAYWISPFASGTISADLASNETPMLSLFTGPFDREDGYVLFSAIGEDGSGLVKKTRQIMRVQKTQKGEIVTREPLTVPYYLAGQKTRLNVVLKENDTDPVKLFVVMYKDGVAYKPVDLEPGNTQPTIEKSLDFEVDSPPGDYVINIEDAKGYSYAATKVTVADLLVETNSTNWQAGRFSFKFTSAGKPVFPRLMSVKLDGKGEVKYSPSTLIRTNANTQIEYIYPGKLDPGKHEFTFDVGDGALTKKIDGEYFARKYFWDDWRVIVLGFISLLVFGAGTILRRPEEVKYGLDVPDFPPLSTIKIPIKRQTVLEVFDSVNLKFTWKWMPLRTAELKTGFGKLTYNGKPILVGDFNLERILAKLKDEGLVKNELDYWGLAAWETESKHTIGYLTLYRIMRNVFVNNAVKFSRLDAVPECDVKTIVGKEEIFFHIMEEPKERIVHRALGTAAKGSTIIVFKTDDDVENFSTSLTSTSKLAVALKMEINNHNIQLLPVKNAISAYLKQKMV